MILGLSKGYYVFGDVELAVQRTFLHALHETFTLESY